MNYLAEYLPNTEDLTPEQLQAGRQRAVEYVRPALPDIVFLFNTSDFRPRVNETALTILAAGDTTTGPDVYELSQTSASTWAVDIPVTGPAQSGVLRGSNGLTSITIPNLISATAVADFASGVPAATLVELAQTARKVAWAYNAATRGGMTSMIYRNWPDSKMVSVAVTGDAELVRIPSTGPTITQAPALDVYYRSPHDMQTERQTIRLEYLACTDNTVSTTRFRGSAPFLGRPAKLVSVEWAGTTAESLITSSTLYSWVPGQLVSDDIGTTAEEFFLNVVPVMNNITGLPEIPLLQDNVGQYAFFTVTYLYDPGFAAVSQQLTHPDNAPVGISLKVKAGPLVDVTALQVEFSRSPGIKVLTDSAASAISSDSLSGYPEAFRPTQVYDRMKQAGAGRVRGTTCAAVVSVSPASRMLVSPIWEPAGPDRTEDWYAWSVPLFTYSISGSIDNLNPEFTRQDTHSGTFLEHWRASDKTVRHYIPKSVVTFLES